MNSKIRWEKQLTPLVRQCQCEQCQQSQTHSEWHIHHQMNLFLSRLDKQQRRWYVALESKMVGRGGDALVSKITGIDVETIRRGRRELEGYLVNSSGERVRATGGGRPAVEKRTPHSKKN